MSRATIIVLVILGLILISCICVGALIFGGASFFMINDPGFEIRTTVEYFSPSAQEPAPTPLVIRPTETSSLLPPAETHEPPVQEEENPEPTATSVSGSTVSSSSPEDTLRTLEDTVIPINDLLDIAARLEGKTNIEPTLPPPSEPLEVGETTKFWVSNTDTDENFQIDATLHYITDNAYFWIEDGISFNENDLRILADTFENEIVPTNRAFFGEEWNPGVDSDPHMYILYTRGVGYSVAGYYSSGDQYPSSVFEYSNAHETFVFSADNVSLDEEYTLSVLAHEHQHMIHWYRDRNETTWLNEGFSELAAFLNGYDPGGFDYIYISNPDIQVNNWPTDPSAAGANYGSSFLLVNYFLERFGDEATQALVSNDENGMKSIDTVLEEIFARDVATGEPIQADDVFVDWAVTNYINDPFAGDGRYSYSSYPEAPTAYPTEDFNDCPVSTQTRSVNQYGVDYIEFSCPGDYTLQFEGSVIVPLLDVDPISGDYAYWSNNGDESDAMLTQEFDFTDVNTPITLSYWTWYDLEEEYDFVYLVASTDGETWDILQAPSMTDTNITGNNYGWGYNGKSDGDGGWIQETVDLSRYAGQTVQLRFEYITDLAVHGDGFLVDDISIPEIGYFTDFEENNGGWEANGFARITNQLPQTFELALIKMGDRTEVEYLPLSEDMVADIDISIGDEYDSVVLVVSGTTRFTRQQAAYRYSLTP